MCSEWKVIAMESRGVVRYAVYRVKNKDHTDQPGNREFATPWMFNKRQAMQIAAGMNGRGER